MTPLRREFSNSRDRNFKPPVFHHIRAAAHNFWPFSRISAEVEVGSQKTRVKKPVDRMSLIT